MQLMGNFNVSESHALFADNFINPIGHGLHAGNQLGFGYMLTIHSNMTGFKIYSIPDQIGYVICMRRFIFSYQIKSLPI